MRTHNRMPAVVAASAIVFGVVTSAWAGEGAPSRVEAMLGKLGRGVANVATCPLELIRTPTLVGRAKGTIAGATTGVFQGVERTVVRGSVGVFEVLTFWLEVPKGFAPFVTPEFIWTDGNWAE